MKTENKLFAAAQSGDLEKVKKLVNSSNIESRDSAGDTPLLVAVLAGHVDVVEALLRSKADITATNNDGDSVMHLAAYRSNLHLLDLLLKYGGDVNARDGDGDTPLHVAIGSYQPEAARWLLDHGADVNAQGDMNSTPLHLARAMMPVYEETGKESPFVKLLEEHGANYKLVDDNGRTPADFPVRRNKTKKR